MTSDVGIQCQIVAETEEKMTSCNIPIEGPPQHCPLCFARENPLRVISDHGYVKRDCPPTSTPRKPTTAVYQSDEEFDLDESISPVKSDKDDPSFHLSDYSEDSPLTSPVKNDKEVHKPKDLAEDSKFIVFLSCLLSLFNLIVCKTCQSPMDYDDIRTYIEGSCLTAHFTCLNSHSFTWRSQPLIGRQPVGNILMTAATYFSGNTYSKISSFAETLNLKFISRSVFYDIANSYVLPSIDKFWIKQQNILLRNMAGRELTLIGDGRCDSPGYSAKYCTYILMEATTSAILDFSVVQVTETGSSSRMELEGFKRTIKTLQDADLNVKVIATDRHIQIRKFIRENLPDMSHQFDVWHMTNSIRKKLVKAAKKKGCEELMPWVRSISNHIWFCAGSCNMDPELLVEMWKSILYHIRDIHTFPGDKFTRCSHAPLPPESQRKKKWLKRSGKAFKALESVINDKKILKDLRQLNLFCHTGDLEVYHSMMLKYVPKRQEFQYPQMVARTQLSALDHNFNLCPRQKETADGQPQFAPVFPKATGRWCVKKRYEAKDYSFRTEMLELVLSAKMNNETLITPHQAKKAILPKNIATVAAPEKSELVEAHVSRFKIN